MTAIVTAACLAGLLSAGYILRVQGAGDTIAALPAPTEPVYPGRACSLPVLKGIHIDPRSLLSIGFVVDSCDERSLERYEVQRLIGYFLAGLTVPDEDLWVNLSPDEEDRVLADGMETTELGRDLLAQDYLLKQLASSLTHPDTPTGQAYWRVENGKSTIENRLGKIWIVPDKAEVYEQGTTVVITESSLKLQCEDEAQQVLLPTITKDVNEGKNFAKLRQIYHSLILARWFKTKLRDSLYAAYIDAHKLKGIDTCDPALKEKIFALYVESFKKGVYDVIRSDSASDQFSILDSQFSKNRRRRFFSGGVLFGKAIRLTASALSDPADIPVHGNLFYVSGAARALAAKIHASGGDGNKVSASSVGSLHGSYDVRISKAGEIIIPYRLRDLLGTDRLFVSVVREHLFKLPHVCIDLGTTRHSDHAYEVALNARGRLRLPQRFLEYLDQVDGSGNVRVVGMIDHLEVWSQQVLDLYLRMTEEEDSQQDTSQLLAEISRYAADIFELELLGSHSASALTTVSQAAQRRFDQPLPEIAIRTSPLDGGVDMKSIGVRSEGVSSALMDRGEDLPELDGMTYRIDFFRPLVSLETIFDDL